LSAPTPPEHPKFEVAVEPAPRTEVVEAEEDEESKRARDAALASAFDPALAHNGKTDEEMIEERQDEARALGDLAIAAAIVIAVTDDAREDSVEFEIMDDAPVEDGGD
jgi:hypothetical protein